MVASAVVSHLLLFGKFLSGKSVGEGRNYPPARVTESHLKYGAILGNQVCTHGSQYDMDTGIPQLGHGRVIFSVRPIAQVIRPGHLHRRFQKLLLITGHLPLSFATRTLLGRATGWCPGRRADQVSLWMGLLVIRAGSRGTMMFKPEDIRGDQAGSASG